MTFGKVWNEYAKPDDSVLQRVNCSMEWAEGGEQEGKKKTCNRFYKLWMNVLHEFTTPRKSFQFCQQRFFSPMRFSFEWAFKPVELVEEEWLGDEGASTEK